MTRFLVTGAAGFIGSHFVRELLAGQYELEASEVTVLDKLTYAGNLENLTGVAADPRYRFVQGDICDAVLLDSLLPGHDVVVNFAAET
ncbi:MAG: GDP-mannose 4,6-dehydratase, partial [Actinomycetales bacterium]